MGRQVGYVGCRSRPLVQRGQSGDDEGNVSVHNQERYEAVRRGIRRRFFPFMPRGTLCSVLYPFLIFLLELSVPLNLGSIPGHGRGAPVGGRGRDGPGSRDRKKGRAWGSKLVSPHTLRPHHHLSL